MWRGLKSEPFIFTAVKIGRFCVDRFLNLFKHVESNDSSSNRHGKTGPQANRTLSW